MIDRADERVKKLFTFHFLGRKYAMTRARDEMIASVRIHDYDVDSPEVRSKCCSIFNE